MGQKKETFIFNFNMNSTESTNSMDNYVKDIQKNKRELQEQLLV